jgi:hypothetical protein
MKKERTNLKSVMCISLALLGAHKTKILGLSALFLLLLPIHLFNILFCWILITQMARSEDNYHIDELFCSLPLKRPAIVTARFLVALLIILAATGLGFIIFHLSLIFTDFYPRGLEIKPGLFTFLFPILLLISSYFPPYFRNGHRQGVEVSFTFASLAAAFWLGLLYIAVSLISGSWQLHTETGVKAVLISQVMAILRKSIAVFGITVFHLVLVGTISLLLVISYVLSLRFYSRREL